MSKSNTAVVIVAGGSGSRFGTGRPKQYARLAGKPVLRWSIESFAKRSDIAAIQVVIGKGHEEEYLDAVRGLDLPVPVYGGKTRQESVLNGLLALRELSPTKVLIHDAARPFVSSNVIDNVLSALKTGKAAVPALPLVDTIKAVASNKVKNTIDKSKLVRVQTPQGFDYNAILEAHRENTGGNYSDDAAVAEAHGLKVVTVEGAEDNFKITGPEDFERAQEKLLPKLSTRTGMGFDVHAFSTDEGKDYFITMCGVRIPYNRKLVGHSDADAGLHAVVDAVLGTIGKGDIGEHFPPSDKKWKGADSSIFARHVAHLLAEHGCMLNNLDVTIICEEPKITPHKKAMVKKLSELFEIYPDRINIKATTTEGLGFTGRKEGIAVQAIATISKLES